MEELLGRETELSRSRIARDQLRRSFFLSVVIRVYPWPNMLNIEMIHEARDRIASRIHHTPVFTSRQFNEAAGKEVFFKCENFQRAGAFKIRGATNKIQSLTPDEKQQGIVAFSSGNHAQAVALAGREAGVRVLVAMPEDAPAAKVAATRDYGAEVVFYDRHKQDREAFALDLAERERLIMVPPYDDYLFWQARELAVSSCWRKCRISIVCSRRAAAAVCLREWPRRRNH